MKRRIIAAGLVGACALVSAASAWEGWQASEGGAAGQPEAITLSPRFVAGEVIDYRVALRTVIVDADDKEAAPQEYIQRFTLRLKVAGVDDRGAAALIGTLRELANGPVVDGREMATWVNGDGAIRDGEEVPPGVSTSAVGLGDARGEVTGAMISMVLRIDAAPDGRITTLNGLDNSHNAAADFGDEGALLLGFFSPASAPRNLESLWRIDTPAESGQFVPRRVGDAWRITDKTRLGAGAMLVSQREYTLGEITEGPSAAQPVESSRGVRLARLGVTGSFDVEAAGGDVTVKIEESKVTGRVEWNATEGRIEKRLTETDVVSAVSVAGITKRSKASVRLEITRSDPALPVTPPE